MHTPLVVPLAETDRTSIGLVGGKNASLGEMIQKLGAVGVRVPNGFAVTAEGYWRFLATNDLERYIGEQLDQLHEGQPLSEVGERLRSAISRGTMPSELVDAITEAYAQMAAEAGTADPPTAVRSSATAEDLPEASFAGQQESFLNISGIDALLVLIRYCFASLFTDRAISYREDLGFEHADIALSVCVQRMVRADLAGAGTAFSIDTETGFPDLVIIDAAWGLGESVVSGAVDPDEYSVFKPLLDHADVCPIVAKTKGRKQRKIVYRSPGGTTSSETSTAEQQAWVLSDSETLQLARWVSKIEEHYEQPVDVEWAKDGHTGELFIVQARPETVQSRKQGSSLRTYELLEHAEPVITGLAIGDAIGAGPVCRMLTPDDLDQFPDGGVLVTGVTDPDWEPIMKRAAAIVTDHGGRTSHAAIVSRELGVPAVVGTATATTTLADGSPVTVSCARGDQGYVYPGVLAYTAHDVDLSDVPETRTRVMVNVADPAAAFRWWRLPANGVGLVRIEFMVASHIKVHPMALVHSDKVDGPTRQRIDQLTRGYSDGSAYFVDQMSYGIARIAAAHWPNPVVVRTSDFKTNEYAKLIGGHAFEPEEENPMLGWRGASRYAHAGYREGFALECRAIRRVRDDIGLTNVIIMIPFCRTPGEADEVTATLADEGLERGRNGLQLYVMAELPSNIILADEFAKRFDGFSIGSNDLTQLTLGVDRDSSLLAELFDEQDPAVTASITHLVQAAHAAGIPVGLCGQRPSNDPEYAMTLVNAGIDSISVTPDSLLEVIANVAAAESQASKQVLTEGATSAG